MIHRLRKRHRVVWWLLALLLPALYLVSLLARPPEPKVESLPELLGRRSSPASGAGR